jgi:hypothetical protein
MPPISRDSLYTEDSFIHYCNLDEFSSPKFFEPINEGFLRAAEKDELIVPLVIEKQIRKLEDGTETEVDVRFYSPFQIFLVAALIRNIVDEDGNLRSPDNQQWQKEQNTRYVKWSDTSEFWVDHYKAKKSEEPDQLGNYFSLADDFHKALQLIHSLPPEDSYELMRDKGRLFTRMPNFAYDLSPVKKSKASYLEQYELDSKKLKRVIANVGSLAMHIDPLERWLYYLQRHARERRDQLKGLAAVSQDLYGFCDIGYEILDAAYEEKLPPLMDLVHPDIKPFMMESAEYAGGDDIKAIRSAQKELQGWVSKNAELLKEFHPGIESKRLEDALSRIEVEINEYEKRYGDRRNLGSTRTIWPEGKLKLDDLDEKVKRSVEMMLKQRTEKMSKEEQAIAIATEITFAIENRMGDLQRSISGIANQIVDATWPLESKLNHEKEMAKFDALKDFGTKVKNDAPDYQLKYSEFWRTGLKECQRPWQDKLDNLKRSRAELHSISNHSRLVFCAVCRSSFVKLHHGHRDDQVTSEAICDGCLTSGKQLTTLGAGEWKCDQCGKLIYKFAHGNVLSDTLRNTSSVTIRLEYGRMEITAKCPNKDCRAEQTRAIDEGWLP